jgi:ethanolamine ammonia-lyase small subunit
MKQLRDFTNARVDLERAGSSVATKEVLAFQLAHAAARDAVHHPLDTTAFTMECDSRGWPVVVAHSQAVDRPAYLRRPDLGRWLATGLATSTKGVNLAIVVADGLSALAVQRHALPLLDVLIPMLDGEGWSRATLTLVEQGRVAIGDEIGQRWKAAIVLVLIGERPGLSSPDSLGAYLTWNPVPGRTDAERNCISNIRPEGLAYQQAAARIFRLLVEARTRQITGVALKEQLPALANLG